jgi:4a-hydroxytetrahydrobiopterin dehydratase
MPPTTAELARKRCQACSDKTPPLTGDELKQHLRAVPLWQYREQGPCIRREYRVKDFLTALDFFQRIGQIAEAEDHHPDLHLTGYRQVAIELSTHAVGGLTENDFILAAKIDQLPVELQTRSH